MKPIVKICNTGTCELVITDLTQDSDEYVLETVEDASAYYTNNKFKYSETCTINLIYKVGTTSDDELLANICTDHCLYLDEAHYALPSDGYYKIYHFILPTESWYESAGEKSLVVMVRDVFTCDPETGKIYKRTSRNPVRDEQSVEDLIEQIGLDTNTVSGAMFQQFSICQLYGCYIALCKPVFESKNYRCADKTGLSDVIFKRDFIWMTINIIKYYVEDGLFMEAQRLLEEVNYCGGFCNELPVRSESGCGCCQA